MRERRAIVIRGIVQGVGFRPFAYHLANRLGLGGFVRNQIDGVLIEIEGSVSSLENFLVEIAVGPPLAQIDSVTWSVRPNLQQDQFHIDISGIDGPSAIFISPDIATCSDCLAEMNDPADRRYRYPFINCTNCGPRLSIITGSPYDRAKTTMAGFRMCQLCQAEYDDPSNRRFHAQPTACPACGPSLKLLDADGNPIEYDPIVAFVEHLRAGRIGALKGIGGYHLTCDASNATAIAELRRRKHRDEKPFAVMVRDIAAVEQFCKMIPSERMLLESSAGPIVVLRIRSSCLLPSEIAPRSANLGILLPYSPLHHQLMARFVNPLIMTSGNRSDEPIAYRDSDALTQLTGIADLFLVHDRPIHMRVEDSVMRVVEDVPLPIRRSRGYAPRPISLPFVCPEPILALGGQMKGAFTLGRDNQAFLSHHLGDLDDFRAYQALTQDVALYQELFGIRPQILVHDLHPEYATTRYATDQDSRTGIRRLGVQHHHAHMASCMAEHQLNEPVIGVIFDGTGYGTDGAIWGGEILTGDYCQFRRAAHFRYVGMPGGDAAVRRPWRMAIAHLADSEAECPSFMARRIPPEVQTIQTMLSRRFRVPLTSSVGRLFDAVAALAGVRDQVSYEGQAAIELEALATGVAIEDAYPLPLIMADESPLIIDTRPMINAIAEDVNRKANVSHIAGRFHAALIDVVVRVCTRLRETTGLNTVVTSGGVFMNDLLTTGMKDRLRDSGFRHYRHVLVPPNDGGLSLGQLAVAAARLHSPEADRLQRDC